MPILYETLWMGARDLPTLVLSAGLGVIAAGVIKKDLERANRRKTLHDRLFGEDSTEDARAAKKRRLAEANRQISERVKGVPLTDRLYDAAEFTGRLSLDWADVAAEKLFELPVRYVTQEKLMRTLGPFAVAYLGIDKTRNPISEKYDLQTGVYQLSFQEGSERVTKEILIKDLVRFMSDSPQGKVSLMREVEPLLKETLLWQHYELNRPPQTLTTVMKWSMGLLGAYVGHRFAPYIHLPQKATALASSATFMQVAGLLTGVVKEATKYVKRRLGSKTAKYEDTFSVLLRDDLSRHLGVPSNDLLVLVAPLNPKREAVYARLDQVDGKRDLEEVLGYVPVGTFYPDPKEYLRSKEAHQRLGRFKSYGTALVRSVSS